MVVKVDVEYCRGWSYGRRYKELEKLIKGSVSDVEMNGVKGRKSCFEIKINSELVFSKLETGKFPDYQEIVALVKKSSKQ